MTNLKQAAFAVACLALASPAPAQLQAGPGTWSANQNMGLNTTFYTTTLVQTSAGCYVIGNCP